MSLQGLCKHDCPLRLHGSLAHRGPLLGPIAAQILCDDIPHLGNDPMDPRRWQLACELLRPTSIGAGAMVPAPSGTNWGNSPFQISWEHARSASIFHHSFDPQYKASSQFPDTVYNFIYIDLTLVVLSKRQAKSELNGREPESVHPANSESIQKSC